MKLIKEMPFPVLLAADDSYQVASKVHDLNVKTRPGDVQKISLIRDLIATQDAAAEHLATLEQRVTLMSMKLQRRLSHYQERVTSLEAENRELSEKLRSMREDGAAQVTTFGTGRINLRDAGFLLRL